MIRSGAIEEFNPHINSIRPSIQFATQSENDGILPFLDTCLQQKKDGSLSISVCRKPTHTDRLLLFESHHPGHMKQGLLRCLFDRSEKVTLDDKKLSKEKK